MNRPDHVETWDERTLGVAPIIVTLPLDWRDGRCQPPRPRPAPSVPERPSTPTALPAA